MKRIAAGCLTLILATGLFVLCDWSGDQTVRLTLPTAPSPLSKSPGSSSLPTLPDRVDFQTQIWPLWESHCLRCHGEQRTEARFRLDLPADNRSESLIVPGESSASELVHRLESTETEFRMPPEQSLSAGEIELVKRWVDEGAYRPDVPRELASDWNVEEQAHWSFQPLRLTEVPQVSRATWIRNPIDSFILERLERVGRQPASPATPQHLLRRLSYSVTGLPPSLEDQYQFQSGTPDDIDALVDELLARPGYGEHFASFWLDLVRYADTNGYEDDGMKPLAWKYRDFVIQSFNEDRPFDQFVAMQIAGDLSEEPTEEDFVAAGFLRLGAWDSEPDDPLKARYDQLDDVVATTSSVFLSLTLECARCHDHPEEPISIQDYYRFAAVFQTLERPVKGRLEQTIPSATASQLVEAAEAQQLQLQLQRQALLESQESRAHELRSKASTLMQGFQFSHAYRWRELGPLQRESRVLLRGNPQTPGEIVTAGPPAILSSALFENQTHPRLQLAKWITTDKRSLLARSIVNRVWNWHFGHGLAHSTSNLGLSGETPTHPELLEWLAYWFAEEADWSLKKLHRLILTSHTYRTAWAGDDPQREALFGSFPRRRLRAEQIFDALLTVSGQRSEERYGPPFYPSLPAEVYGTLVESGSWKDPDSTGRRAIYAVVKRNLPYPLFEAFDVSQSARSCDFRAETFSVNQALLLWNSRLVDQAAQKFAERILAEAGADLNSQVDFAFQSVLSRSPDDWERERFVKYLEEHSRQSERAVDERIPLSQLCLVLFNLNEFVYLD